MKPLAKPAFNAGEMWNATGLTEHLGGPSATRRLIAMARFKRDGQMLDAGCGSGFSACLLASELNAHVMALDVRDGVLRHAAQRTSRAQFGSLERLIRGDLHALPFADASFDGILCESVLAFCDQPRALAELVRVLRPGGVMGSNEMTFLRPLPPRWEALFSSGWMGIDLRPHQQAEWHTLFGQSGLRVEFSEVSAISLKTQAKSHLEVDGIWRYLSAVTRNLARPAVWRTFFSPSMWPLWREYPTIVGMGLYCLRKPPTNPPIGKDGLT